MSDWHYFIIKVEIHSQGCILIETQKENISTLLNTYLDMYSQLYIVTYLKLSKSMISKVVKSGDSLTGV
jgi:hypothetical protein